MLKLMFRCFHENGELTKTISLAFLRGACCVVPGIRPFSNDICLHPIKKKRENALRFIRSHTQTSSTLPSSQSRLVFPNYQLADHCCSAAVIIQYNATRDLCSLWSWKFDGDAFDVLWCLNGCSSIT